MIILIVTGKILPTCRGKLAVLLLAVGVHCSNKYMIHIASNENFLATVDYGLQVLTASGVGFFFVWGGGAQTGALSIGIVLIIVADSNPNNFVEFGPYFFPRAGIDLPRWFNIKVQVCSAQILHFAGKIFTNKNVAVVNF